MVTKRAIKKPASLPVPTRRRAVAVAATEVANPRRRVVVVQAANDEEEFVEPSYFALGADKSELEFVSSGCSVLDEALGGGYALGRVANIVGDKSSGKTLSAMEIVANFAIAYPDGWVRYSESEAAFDRPYAGALGIPLDRIEFNADDAPMETVEDLYSDMLRLLDKHKGSGRPGLYIIDSLDALSDAAEIAAAFNEASYGGTKPKAIGQLFRRLVRRLEEQRVLFVIISQIRDIMNAKAFQQTKTRSGGKALDFYATHILWIAEIGKKTKERGGIKRIVGVDVKADVRKNKIGLAYRKVDYPILFGYGIDDMMAAADWLVENKREGRLAELGMSKGGYPTLLDSLRNKGGPEVRDMRERLAAIVRKEWAEIETTFLPQSRKY